MMEARVGRRTQRTIQPRLFIILALLIALAGSGLYWLLSRPAETTYYALSAQEIELAAANAPITVSSERKLIIDSALSLVGKVNYFWGGKYTAVGWNDEWGQMREVTSEGSQNTGKMMPYGLDCSGYIAWCFVQSGMTPEFVQNNVGIGTYYQWENSTAISWDQLQPGDLAFQNKPGSENHVGICIGFDDENQPVFAHCASKFDNVVVTHRGEVFNHPRRPNALQ